jgi:hypothetical protein
VAGATGLDTEAATAFAVDELKIDDPAGPPEQAADSGGITVTLARLGPTAQLRIAIPDRAGDEP